MVSFNYQILHDKLQYVHISIIRICVRLNLSYSNYICSYISSSAKLANLNFKMNYHILHIIDHSPNTIFTTLEIIVAFHASSINSKHLSLSRNIWGNLYYLFAEVSLYSLIEHCSDLSMLPYALK